MKIGISVVIAYFNGSPFIERAIESTRSSEFDIDLIVVDDGSSKRDADYLLKLQGEYDFRIVAQENKGQGAARNAGIMASLHDLICFLDQDDYFLGNHYSVLSKALLENPQLDFAYGDLWRVDTEGFRYKATCIFDSTNHDYHSLARLLSQDLHVLPSAAIFKKACLVAVNGFDETLRGYEDDDLMVRLFLNGHDGKVVDEAVSAWTLDVQSTSFQSVFRTSRAKFFAKHYGAYPLRLNGTTIDDLLFSRFALQTLLDSLVLRLSSAARSPEIEASLEIIRDYALNRLRHARIERMKYLSATYAVVKLPRAVLEIIISAGALLSPRFRQLRSNLN